MQPSFSKKPFGIILFFRNKEEYYAEVKFSIGPMREMKTKELSLQELRGRNLMKLLPDGFILMNLFR